MSLLRYHHARRLLVGSTLFPYPLTGLVQCCDITLDRPAAGVVTQWKDVSGNNNHLVASPNGGPTLGTAPDGRAAITALATNQYLSTAYSQGYQSFTIVLLQYVEPVGGYTFFWFGRPQPEYQPSPFLYTENDQLKSYFSSAYGNYGNVYGQWQLVVFSFEAGSGDAFVYQTGRGFSASENPAGATITGATLAAFTAEKYRAFSFYNRYLTTNETEELRATLSTRHNLTL